ncbi:MAG: hypothetical protein NC402_07180 [Prevotella sp.]|nr:hypothetical protein [Prevotella sp.]MCM1074341.1 hypothetical protein [Ruminococcus sp.]
MKSIKLTVFLALFALFGINLSSCSSDEYSNSKAAEMVQKDEKGKLKKADYTEMLKWYEQVQDEYYEEWLNLLNKRLPYTDYILEYAEMRADLISDYPYYEYIENIINAADEEEMGDSNFRTLTKLQEKYTKKYDKYVKKQPESKKKPKDNEEVYVEEEVTVEDPLDY